LRDILAWIEATGLGHMMRESGPWTYAIVNVAHVLAVATLFGSVFLLDLRLLGAWSRRIRIGDLSSAVAPVGMTAFAIALASGAALLATKATAYVDNPFLLIKFPAIGLGMLNVGVLNLTPAWREVGHRDPSPGERRQLAIMGAISLLSWITAIVAGRMIGYW
jgi:Family of unknown function (DUF6644)